MEEFRPDTEKDLNEPDDYYISRSYSGSPKMNAAIFPAVISGV